ncbi:hypothetical protein HMF8227_01142 [Saliniradius amylolyticus]|uniref:Uncharacterized protein n=1 Tax=Saliniradius amylolyticus TaxID=2183582 RepID=A0A2S2E1V5_9ALTE|nr:6-hydroxymethylpterin diphosphokinase MptE-like protein [Saliniradius amylolyticus]AWL11623.1 hypothetical protein HMF8227_01142 [Saliniradius amylolyticus]
MDELKKELAELEKRLDKAKAQQEQQRAFEQESQRRFDNNLLAFKRFFPEIYESICSYTPSDDFRVFVTPTGEGNYIPKGQSVPIYSEEPIAQSRRQVERNVANPVFGRSSLYGKPDEATKTDERLHMRYMCKLAEAINQFDHKNEPKLDKLPEHYPTCIVFGIGLGYHLPILFEQHQFDYIFLCEPDFETFYASLYCTDWCSLMEKVDVESGCLFIQVGIPYETFFNVLRTTYQKIGAFSLISSFCYQHTPVDEVNKLIKEFFNNFYQVQFGYGFYNDALTGLAHGIRNVEKPANFLLRTRVNRRVLSDIPVFIIGNGPSLDQAASVIKENANEAIILAAGSAFQSLLKLGIQPDFHVLVERPKITYDVVCDTLPEDIVAKTNLLAVDVIYPDVLDKYEWAGLGLKGPEAATVFIQQQYLRESGALMASLPNAAPLVANTALSFAYMMGFQEIYLFGVDNGYPADGDSHSQFSIYKDVNFSDRFNLDTNAEFELPGNLGGTVKATKLLAIARQQMASLLKDASTLDVYNVGQGAAIEGATPLTEEDVLCLPAKESKDTIIERIKQSFFVQLKEDDLEQSVGVEEFTSLCDYLLSIGEESYSSRQEANDILKRQSRVVFAYQGSKYSHLFHIIKGTLLYFHCPLISMLYLFKDEKRSLEYFNACFPVWQECIRAMRDDFAINWKTKCGHSWEVSQYQKRLNEEARAASKG